VNSTFYTFETFYLKALKPSNKAVLMTI